MARHGVGWLLALLAGGWDVAEAAPATWPQVGHEAVATLSGPPAEVVARGGPPALYVERVWGVRGGGGWEAMANHHTATRVLRLVLPGGGVEVSTDALRLYVPPLGTRTWQPAEEAAAPPPVREALRREHGPITEEVYALRARTPYHVRLVRETSLAPPVGDEDPPRELSHLVWWVSDRPFAGGRPDRPLSPLGQRRTY